MIERAITPTEWARIYSCAKRVRELRSTAYVRRTHPSVWLVLEDLCKGSPLFPRLRRIAISIDCQAPHGAMFLLSPSLETVQLSFHRLHDPDPSVTVEGQYAAGMLLGLISSRLPKLSSLTISDGLLDLDPSHLDSVARFSQLQILHLQHSGAVVENSTLQLISRMPALRVVDLALCLMVADEGPGTQLVFGDAFRGVREAGFKGDLEDLVQVFKATSWESLTKLSLVGMTGTSSADEMRDGIAAICSKLPPALRSAVLHLDDAIPRPTVSVIHFFQPLLSFSRLNSFKAGLPKYIPSVSDEDLCAFATAWPLLEAFSLTHNMSKVVQVGPPDMVPVYHPTVLGLLAFARHCPRLEVLTLPAVNVYTLPSPNSIPAIGHSTLRHLFVDELCGGDRANLLDLAVILDLLFPSLQVTRELQLPAQQAPTYHTYDVFGMQKNRDAWELTRKLLGTIQARREHKGPEDAPLLAEQVATS